MDTKLNYRNNTDIKNIKTILNTKESFTVSLMVRNIRRKFEHIQEVKLLISLHRSIYS